MHNNKPDTFIISKLFYNSHHSSSTPLHPALLFTCRVFHCACKEKHSIYNSKPLVPEFFFWKPTEPKSACHEFQTILSRT